MEKQQKNQKAVNPTTPEPRVQEQPERRQRLQLDLLEARVAPNAIWGE